MANTSRDKFKDLYDGKSRKELAKIGQEYLDNDLRLRSRKHSKRFWWTFSVFIAIVCVTGLFAACFLLLKTKKIADGFENGRNSKIRTIIEETNK